VYIGVRFGQASERLFGSVKTSSKGPRKASYSFRPFFDPFFQACPVQFRSSYFIITTPGINSVLQRALFRSWIVQRADGDRSTVQTLRYRQRFRAFSRKEKSTHASTLQRTAHVTTAESLAHRHTGFSHRSALHAIWQRPTPDRIVWHNRSIFSRLMLCIRTI
jgi:hypothetical protein